MRDQSKIRPKFRADIKKAGTRILFFLTILWQKRDSFLSKFRAKLLCGVSLRIAVSVSYAFYKRFRFLTLPFGTFYAIWKLFDAFLRKCTLTFFIKRAGNDYMI